MADEIGRWLRRVRPNTAADEDWATSSEADQALAAIHRKTAPAKPLSRLRVNPAVWLPAGALATAAVVVVAMALASSPSQPPKHLGIVRPNRSNITPTLRPASFLLSTDSSCDDLLAQLRSHTAANAQTYGLSTLDHGGVYNGSVPVGLAPAPGAPAAAGAEKSANTSTTNIQEPGVDEPDIVKTDGDRLITVTDGVLRVIDTATRTVTGTLDLTVYSGWQGAQLLVDGSHALVTLNQGLSAGPEPGPAIARPLNPASGQSTYLFVNLDGQPTVTGSLRASGSYLDARMIGSTVRLVVSSNPVINLPVSAYNGTATAKGEIQKTIRQAPLSAWLPKYSISVGASTTTRTVACSRVSHPTKFSGTSMLTVYTLQMNNLSADPSPVTVAADGDTVYANTSSLYIASNPDWFCCDTSTNQNTEIHRFDITGFGLPTYLGSGVVPGRLLSSYSLSDDGGYLRIATTSGENDGSAGASNSVFVLADDTLKVIGHVDGLGKGERIYAVRFMGPMAYVVTFRQTDPLYVVDLHDPSAPKVVGALTLSGVSNYLHDVGNGRLLGVGQQITAGEGSGVQVSLFDVSSASNPKRVDNLVVPNTPWALNFDPHTFLYWQPTGLVVVPAQSWSGSESGRVLVVRLDGDHLTKLGLLANPRPASLPDDGQGIQRSLIVNGDLWTVSGGGVQVSAQSNLERIAWIAFE